MHQLFVSVMGWYSKYEKYVPFQKNLLAEDLFLLISILSVFEGVYQRKLYPSPYFKKKINLHMYIC